MAKQNQNPNQGIIIDQKDQIIKKKQQALTQENHNSNFPSSSKLQNQNPSQNLHNPPKPQINNFNYSNYPNGSGKESEQIQLAAEEDDEENYEMEFLECYHGKAAKNVRLIKQDFTDDGKVIKYFENDKKEIIFPSGVKKETFLDGYQITFFNNKDIKQIYPDGKEVYLFSENQTVQFKFADGLQVFKFQDGQIEKNFADGIKHIIYKDGTVKYIYPDQSDETIFPDGTLQKTDVTGVITIDYVDQIRVRV